MEVCSKTDLLFLGSLRFSRNTTRFSLFQFTTNYERMNRQKYYECYLNGECAHWLTLFKQIEPPTDSTTRTSDGFLGIIPRWIFLNIFAFIDASNIIKCSCWLRNVCRSFPFRCNKLRMAGWFRLQFNTGRFYWSVSSCSYCRWIREK